jgi:excisionase family DNA binding protein
MTSPAGPSATDGYLLLSEVAELARAPISTVRFWVLTGRPPSSRPGKRRLVRRRDLERFLRRDIQQEASR